MFAIEACGGQQTNDKKRLRTGGGILLNILKSREPKAYKHIVTEGKKFEVPKIHIDIFYRKTSFERKHKIT